MEQTPLNPLALVFCALAGLLIIILPRRYALAPLLIAICYVTVGQVIYVAGLDFTIYRILLLCGMTRILFRGEFDLSRLNIMDKAVIAWILVWSVTHSLLVGSMAGIINSLGSIYDTIGSYFVFRILIRSSEDVQRVFQTIAIAIVPLAVTMTVESMTGKNIFSVFGGVDFFSAVRDERIRAQGAFRHPILAGTFGATTLPLVFSLWWSGEARRWWAVFGISAAIVITVTAASSGPILTILTITAGMLAWRVRNYLPWLCIAGVWMLAALQLFMKVPIWFLIARISELVGGGGYHRSALINAAVAHFDEWWLLGTTYTAHWMPYQLPINPDMVDITNYYIRMGVDGGLISMFAFIAMIAVGFWVIGRTTRILEEMRVGGGCSMLVWALGVCLAGHAAAFFSVSYFDQIIIFWHLLLALIALVKDFGDKVIDSFPEQRALYRMEYLKPNPPNGVARQQ